MGRKKEVELTLLMRNFAHTGKRNPLRDRDEILHVITYATFDDDRLWGLVVARGRISHFPIDCVVAFTTLSH